MRAAFFAWIFGACALLQGAQAPLLYTDDNFPADVLKDMMHGQDLALSLDFDGAEAAIREGMRRVPDHPLSDVFLMATLLSRTQENFRGGKRVVEPSFFKQVEILIARAEAQHKAFPHSAYPRYYLAAGYGVRGLARLYAGSYFSSYRDGKRGAALLQEAVAIHPKLYNAYMGLGQFEYYCGTLGSVLQFLLALPGDPDKGLALLKTCEEQATYAAWPCKAYRVKLIIADRKDYAAVEPDLAALVARHPGNHDFAQAVFLALAAGHNTAALRSSGEDIVRRLHQGWDPPPHARLNETEANLALAEAYLALGQRADALPHLERAAAGNRPVAAQRARALLAKP